VIDLPAPAAVDPEWRECEAMAANEAVARALQAAGPFDIVYERAALWSVAPMVHAARSGAVGVIELNAPLLDEQARYRTLILAHTARVLLASALQQARLVVAVSDAVAAWASHLVPTANVHVVPNGVDVRRFDPSSNGRGHTAFVVGFVGTLKPWHGLPVLVEAFARLAADVPDARLLIVGDGPCRREIESSLARLGCADHATLTGAVDPEQVPGLLSQMDVAVAPYPPLHDFYFSPLKLTEYMAAGLPVVASAVGQVTCLVRHDETGLSCAPGDARSLASALARLYTEPRLRERLGRNARALVAEQHTWTRALARILQLAGSGQGVGVAEA
jgi:glycosyltransferase involved in cell wall biosynthesis